MRKILNTEEVLILFVVSILSSICICFLIEMIYNLYDTPYVANHDFIAQLQNPEPLEKLIFTLLAAGMPAIILLGNYFSPLRFFKIKNKHLVKFFIFIAAIFVAPFLFKIDLAEIIFKWGAGKTIYCCITFVAAVLLALYISLFYKKSSHKSIVWIVSIASFLISALAFRIFNENFISEDAEYHFHFDSVIYSLSQVVFGKTLLADLPAQYGLYSELLLPIFKVVPFTIFNITFLFAFLQFIAICAITFTVNKYIKNTLLAILCILGISLVAGNVFLFLHSLSINPFNPYFEPYFQYFPIRFLLPTVSIVMFSIYCEKRSLKNLLLISILAAISCLWNLDSGVPVAVSLSAFLFAKLLFSSKNSPQEFRLRLIHLITYCVVFITTIVIFFLWLEIKSGKEIHVLQLILYQQSFWKAGFFMLPLPMPIHPWMSVLLLYLLGIIIAVKLWQKGSDSKFSNMIFFISLLGTGLFTYYCGRSHIYNLVLVSWPALLLGAMLTDYALRCAKIGYIRKNILIITFPYLIFIALCAINFTTGIPSLIRAAENHLRNFNSPKSQHVAEEINFIKEKLHGRKCLILSMRQGIYYTQLGYASPIDGPGLVESFFKKDWNNILTVAENGTIPCIFFGLKDSNPVLLMTKFPIEPFLNNYKISSYDKNKTMVLLEIKNNDYKILKP